MKRFFAAAWVWIWWALEQFAVLFLPKERITAFGDVIPPCPTCWWYRGVLFGVLLGSLLGYSVHAQPVLDPLKDYRYCGPPSRDSQGHIIRSQKALTAFKRQHPCPVQKLTGVLPPRGTCPGWAVDHSWPLADCGCDAVFNMQWLPIATKSCAGNVCKDRWERKIYSCTPLN